MPTSFLAAACAIAPGRTAGAAIECAAGDPPGMAEQHEGVPILVVQGNVASSARTVVEVPRIKFIARNVARREIYSWTVAPSRTVLPPGEAIAFRSRLASPPPDAQDVLVRFVDRRDVLAGTR